MTAPVIPIAENLYRIPTMGSAINSFLFIENDSSLTLIDTGIPSAPEKITKALKFLKQDVSNIKNLIFTHSHDDHAGGGAKMIELIGSPTVLAHEKEIEYLESGKNPPRDLSHLAGLFFRFMPEGGFEKIAVTRGLTDGEVLPLGGGLKIIHTPGHTPGHISLLHMPSQTLITGDSVFNFGFKIAWSLSAFCTNFNQSKETAQRFLDLDFGPVAFTHGPHIANKGKEKLKNFLR